MDKLYPLTMSDEDTERQMHDSIKNPFDKKIVPRQKNIDTISQKRSTFNIHSKSVYQKSELASRTSF